MSYRTTSLRRVYESIVRLRGLGDPSTSRYTPSQRAQAAELITDRLRVAWETEMWPELLKVERRQFADTYAAGTTYAAGDTVFYAVGTEEGYFTSLQDANTGNTPSFAAATAWWEKAGDDFVTMIDFEQTWASEVIGAVDVKRGVFARDPRLHIDERPLDRCRIIEGAALLVQDTQGVPARVWVRFRPPAPQVSLDVHNPAVVYPVGALCFDEVTGDAYEALQVNQGVAPGTDSAVWDRVVIPYIFGEYIKHGVVADLEREDQGRLRSEARAQEELDRVRDVQFEQRGEVRRATYRRA